MSLRSHVPSVSPPYGSHIPHVSGQGFRYQDTPNSYARTRGGHDSTPRSFNQTSENNRDETPSPFIGQQPQALRPFGNLRGEDLIELFPHLFDPKSPSKVEEAVQRCKCSGEGVLYIEMPSRGVPLDQSRPQDETLRRLNAPNRGNNTQDVLDLSDRYETENRQANTQNQTGNDLPGDDKEESSDDE